MLITISTLLFSSLESLLLNILSIENKSYQNTWIFFIVLAILVLFSYTRISYSKSFTRLFKALLNINLGKEILRDQNLLDKKTILCLSVIFYLSSGLFLYQTSIYFNWRLKAGIENGFLLSFFFVASIYQLKYLFVKTFGFIFNLAGTVGHYIFYIRLTNNLIGIILIPLNIIMAFSNKIPVQYTINIALAAIIICLLHRYFRGGELSNFYIRFYKLHFFLYLCTFEIIPWLILIKFFEEHLLST